MKKCPKCGTQYTGSYAGNFCFRCGSSLENRNAPGEKRTIKECTGCGNRYNPSMMGDFCPACGNRMELREVYGSELIEAGTQHYNKTSEASAYRGTENTQESRPEKKSKESGKKSHTGRNLALVLLLIILLAVIVVPAGMIFMMALDTASDNPGAAIPRMEISGNVSYHNPYPQMKIVSFDVDEGWDLSRGFYSICNYTIENTGDADGYVDITLSGSSKGRLYKDTKLIRKGSVLVDSVQINTNEYDTSVHINCSNIEKIGGYYDGYYATVDYKVTNNGTIDKVGTVVLKTSSGAEVYRKKILVTAGKTYKESVKIDLKDENTIISSIRIIDIEYV